MAQQDTGLGWSAKSEWLVQVAGTIAEVNIASGGSMYPGQPIPVLENPSIADVMAVGIHILTFTHPTYHWIRDVYATANNTAFIYIAESGSSYFMAAISDSPDTVITFVSIIRDSPTLDTATTQLPIRGTNFYYTQISGGVSSANTVIHSNIPVFSGNVQETAGTAASYITIGTVPISKDNAGYAVGCLAKWRTSANVIIESPILISNDTSFTDMSTSSSYMLAKYNTRRDGMTFYMSFYQDISDTIRSALPVYDISGPEEPYANLDELFNLICAPDQANVLITETTDPYEDFPITDEDAGEVDPDPEDDEIEEEDLPTMSFATAGFCRIYRPSFSQVSALASYMWTDQNFLQTVINHLKQILENPIDAIISLSIVPCVPDVLADEEVKVMYVPTGVYMPPVQRQFVSVDCGSFTLKEMYGSALDYNPYTSVQLYLPYVGIVQLDTDEVMGKTLSIKYRIDVVTGVCCAYVKAAGDVLYQFSGHCSIHQPITSADFSGYINAALAAGKLVASIAAAGAGAPAVAATLAGAPTPSISGTESKTVETERNPNTGRQITVGTRRRESQTYNPGASFGEVATRGVSNTVGAVMNSKTIVQHSGGFSGNSGFLAAVRRPYLIVTRPRIANPENYGKYNGRPSMIYLNLGDCTGFTQVQSIHLTGIDATNPELSEIATLLNSGVIL